MQVVQLKPLSTTKLETTTGQTVKIIKENFTAGAAVVHVVNEVGAVQLTQYKWAVHVAVQVGSAVLLQCMNKV